MSRRTHCNAIAPKDILSAGIFNRAHTNITIRNFSSALCYEFGHFKGIPSVTVVEYKNLCNCSGINLNEL